MPDGSPTYVIDASCLTHIDQQPNANLVWDTVIGLIEGGRLKTVQQVMAELQNVDPAAYARVKAYRPGLVIGMSVELFREAGRISETHTTMSRPWHRNDSADPWLVAAAKLEGHVVVTDELPRRRRMPIVCDREGVVCMNLTNFIEAETARERSVERTS